ncbi:MAG: dienelactone hydrolase family protein [Omnitrophica WOR_2 bacterium]
MDITDSIEVQPTFTGYLAQPAGGTGNSVLVFHAWWGLNDFFKSFCRRLAGEGFITLAPDFYHREVARTIPQAEQLMKNMDDAAARQQAAGAASYLSSLPGVESKRLAVIGFSMGAGYAIDLAANQPEAVNQAIIFYGTQDADFSRSQAAFQGHFAGEDPYESKEDVGRLEERLKAAGRPVQFYTYPGTKHWFYEADRPEYDATAAEHAWQRTLEFLNTK